MVWEKLISLAIAVLIEDNLRKILLIELVLLFYFLLHEKFKPYLSMKINLSTKISYILLSLIISVKIFCSSKENLSLNSLLILDHILAFYLIFWLFKNVILIKGYYM